MGSRDGTHQRTFQSREIVWQTFESLARELDAPIDELVNDAMEAYAKVRGYPKADSRDQYPPPSIEPHRDPLEETHDAPAVSALDRSYAPPRAAAPIPAAGRPAPPTPPPPMQAAGGWDDDDDLARTAARGSFQRPQRGQSLREPTGESERGGPRFAAAFARPPGAPMAAPPPSMRRMSPMPAPPASAPPDPFLGARPALRAEPPALPPRMMPPTTMPMPGAPRHQERSDWDRDRESPHQQQAMSPGASTKRLVLTYQGRPYAVEKERFLIGRSKTQADLRLDDPNVSRQHAVIERAGAAWYIVDLGSTNGVSVHGDRVARRALQDGDLVTITSHEIRVSLR